ncbi:hypothetical protein L195_g047900, partial [Trifolium pratense]
FKNRVDTGNCACRNMVGKDTMGDFKNRVDTGNCACRNMVGKDDECTFCENRMIAENNRISYLENKAKFLM